jgi:tRNA dimethylallyltransferase
LKQRDRRQKARKETGSSSSSSCPSWQVTFEPGTLNPEPFIMESKQKIIVIAGPTASGKSGLAMDMALRFGGEIVNADSMQVYRWMDIGTAKPSAEERGRVPHHLLDVVDPDKDFNAADYRTLALPALQQIRSRGKTAFVVGGTGLYIRVLLGGLIHLPPSDPDFRKGLQAEMAEQGTGGLHARLKSLDPESAERIHPNDRVRITRALEIIHLTGKPFSPMIREHGFKDSPFRALKICLQIGRDQLYHRIDARSVHMFEMGLLGETAELLERGYSPDLKPMNALGYRHMIRVIQGRWDLGRCLERLQADTRRYAKRQLTWFRADPEMVWLNPKNGSVIEERIREFLAQVDEE